MKEIFIKRVVKTEYPWVKLDRSPSMFDYDYVRVEVDDIVVSFGDYTEHGLYEAKAWVNGFVYALRVFCNEKCEVKQQNCFDVDGELIYSEG